MRKLFIFSISILLGLASVFGQIDRSKQPTPGPSPLVKVQKPKSFTLPNGLKVFVVENNKLPQFSMTLTLDNPIYTEGDKKGIDALLGSMMGKGTTKTPKDKFQEEVDFMGATISYSASGGFAEGLSKFQNRIVEMFAEGALMPLFTEEEFKKEKDKAIEALKASEKSVSAKANELSLMLAYGKKHPFGEVATETTYNNIQFADIKQHYDTYYSPQNAYLVVVGDVKFDTIKKLIEKHFSAWKRVEVPSKTYPNPSDVAKTQINFLDMPNAVQSEVRIMNLTELKMTDPDYFAALLANFILGGGGESRLFMNLREKRGFTYGAYSSIRGNKYISRFVAQGAINAPKTDSAVIEFMNEIRRIRTELVSDEELALAKAKYLGNFVMDVQKPETIARFALTTQTQSLPPNFYENYVKNINAVTKEEILAAAKKYIKEDKLRIVIAAKGEDIADKIEKLGYPVYYYNKDGQPVDKPIFSKPIPAGVTVQTVFDNYLAKIGGKDKVSKVKTIYMEGAANIPGAPISLNYVIKYKAPNKEMTEVSAEGMGSIMKKVFDGKTGYALQMGQRKDFTPEEIKKNMEIPSMFPELSAKNAKLESIVNVNGKDAYKVLMYHNGENKLIHYYDLESGLLVKSEETLYDENEKKSMTTSSEYSDYKPVKGILMYHTISFKVQGMDLKTEMSKVLIDEGVKDSDFK